MSRVSPFLGALGLAVVITIGCSDKAVEVFFCNLGLQDKEYCSCIKKNTNINRCHVNQPPSSNDNRPPLGSVCICAQKKGIADKKVTAYFTSRPTMYGQFPTASYPLQAYDCDNDLRCPIVETTGGVDKREYVTSNRLNTFIRGWGENLNVYWLDGEIELPKQPFSQIPAFNCEDQCSKYPPSPFCTRLNPTGSASTKAALRDVYLKVADVNTKLLSRTYMMEAFKVKHDPCNRGDIFLVDSVLNNSGDSCKISHSIEGFSIKGLTLSARVSGQLNGKLTRRTDSVKFDFDDVEKAPFLNFSDIGLDSELGGRIHKLVMYPSKYLFSTTNGCIELNTAANAAVAH